MSLLAAARQRVNAHLPPGSLRARMVGGAAWRLGGAVIDQGTSAVAAILVARLLGRAAFGELGMVRSTIGMFGALAGFSLGLTANRYVAQLKDHDPQRAGRILGLATGVVLFCGLAMTALVLVLAKPLAIQTLGAPEMAGYLRLASPMLAMAALAGVLSGALSGFEAFRELTTWGALAGALSSLLLFVGALVGGIPGAIVGGTAGSALVAGGYAIALAHICRSSGVPFRVRGAWAERRVLGAFAFPSLLSGLMVLPVNWAASAMLVNAARGGFAELGAFNAANQWRMLILFAPSAVGQVVLPMLAAVHASRDRNRYVRVLRANVAINAAAALALAVPVSVASPWVMAVYGKEFRAYWPSLMLLSAAAVVNAVLNVVAQVIASTGDMWWGFVLNLIWGAELLLATWLLLPYGANGLSAANLIAYALHAVQVGAYAWFVIRRGLAAPEATVTTAPALDPAAAA